MGENGMLSERRSSNENGRFLGKDGTQFLINQSDDEAKSDGETSAENETASETELGSGSEARETGK